MENNNNKKEIYIKFNKKVVAVSFLALALFMLFAVSYAYFTATVEGNEDAKKVTVTTGEMKLKLTGPDTEIKAEHLTPGQSTSIKFSVENVGTVPAIYNLDMIEVTNDFIEKSDLVYSVESTNGGGTAQDVEAPSKEQTLIRNIYIDTGKKQDYTLILTFKETYVNQNSNQGRTFEGRVQINNLDDKSLATTILRTTPIQSSEGLDYYSGSPKCIKFGYDEEYNYICEAYGPNGEGVFAAPDNDGTSYFFRGAVTNNNVSFAGKKWKIIRINGDGSVRLIYNDDNGPGHSKFNDYTSGQKSDKFLGFTYDNAEGKECTKAHPCEVTYDSSTGFSNEKFGGHNSTIKDALEAWYTTNLNSVDDKITYGLFCNDVSSKIDDDYYGPSDRVTGDSSLICPDPNIYDENPNEGNPKNYGGLYKTKIGIMTLDELFMAGFAYYLDDDRTNETNYLYQIGDFAWTLSPRDGMDLYYGDDGTIRYSGYSGSLKVVPVINLSTNVTFTGSGTEDKPYTIVE